MITMRGLMAGYKKEILFTALLSLSFYLFHAWSYDKGYTEASNNFQNLQKIALDEALANYERKVNEAFAHKEKDTQQAEVTKQAEVIVQTKVQTVTKYVDKIVVTNECSSLATDVVSLLSESTGIVKEATRSADSQDRTAFDEALRRTF
jgi:hypothetical protein